MHCAFVLLAAGLVITGPQAEPMASSSTRATIGDCLISPKQKAQVSAQEGGVLMEFFARPGDQVTEGQWLGRIDDSQPMLQKQAAEVEYNSAKEQAESDVNIRFAQAARNVASAELEQAQLANKRVRGAISEAEVRRRRFALDRAELQIEQAELEHSTAQFTLKSRKAELDAATRNVERRQLRAPFQGVIVEVLKQVGEWVDPGNPVFRVMRLDQLYVDGFLQASDYLPSEVSGRPVTVTAQLTRRRSEQFHGYVVFVSPEVDPVAGVFKVRALVQNEKAGNEWLLRPGLDATMSIDLTGEVRRPPSLTERIPQQQDSTR